MTLEWLGSLVLTFGVIMLVYTLPDTALATCQWEVFVIDFLLSDAVCDYYIAALFIIKYSTKMAG